MSIHRARAACPSCNTEEEVWIYKSSIFPINTIECANCKYMYEANDFIVCLMDLRQNTTFSSTMVRQVT